MHSIFWRDCKEGRNVREVEGRTVCLWNPGIGRAFVFIYLHWGQMQKAKGNLPPRCND